MSLVRANSTKGLVSSNIRDMNATSDLLVVGFRKTAAMSLLNASSASKVESSWINGASENWKASIIFSLAKVINLTLPKGVVHPVITPDVILKRREKLYKVYITNFATF